VGQAPEVETTAIHVMDSVFIRMHAQGNRVSGTPVGLHPEPIVRSDGGLYTQSALGLPGQSYPGTGLRVRDFLLLSYVLALPLLRRPKTLLMSSSLLSGKTIFHLEHSDELSNLTSACPL
jgi:hypothetical protein